MEPARKFNPVMWLVLAVFVGLAQLLCRSAGIAANPISVQHSINASPSPSGNAVAQSNSQTKAYNEFLEAEKRAENQALAAMPGRARFWRAQSESTRRRLDAFGRDLAVLRDRQAAFDATLTPEQKTKLEIQLRRIHGLSDHIQRDFQSLQDELRKGYPTRRHVDADTWDMYKELGRWKKLDRSIAEAVGVGRIQAPARERDRKEESKEADRND